MGIFKKRKKEQLSCLTCNRIFFLDDLFCYCPYCHTLNKGVNGEYLYLDGCKKCGTLVSAWSCPDLLCGAKHYQFQESGKLDENKLMFIFLEEEHLPYMKGVPTITYGDYKDGYRFRLLNYTNHSVAFRNEPTKPLYIPFNHEIPKGQYNDPRRVEVIKNKLKSQNVPIDDIEEEEKPSMIGDILSIIFKKDFLNHQIEIQELENKLSGLQDSQMRQMIETLGEVVEVKEKNAAAEITAGRADLLQRCIDNIDKLSPTSLRYILLSFANPNKSTPEQDSEIIEQLDNVELKSRDEDLKSKQYDNMLKKDKYDEIKKNRKRK